MLRASVSEKHFIYFYYYFSFYFVVSCVETAHLDKKRNTSSPKGTFNFSIKTTSKVQQKIQKYKNYWFLPIHVIKRITIIIIITQSSAAHV